MVTRRQWSAAPPRRRYGARGRTRTVVVHHTSRRSGGFTSGDRSTEAAYMREMQRKHIDRGFNDIGYHFVVMPSGRVLVGRPLSALGAHVAGHNVGAIGVALAGNFDETRPTPEAIRSLDWLLGRLARRLALRRRQAVAVIGHGDLDTETSCPGRYLRAHLERRAG